MDIASPKVKLGSIAKPSTRITATEIAGTKSPIWLVSDCTNTIAIENTAGDTFQTFNELFRAYPADFLGLCFDSGHGHLMDDKGLDHLDEFKDRLMALHIHDNDGITDLHQPPFCGTLDWERFAKILKASPYPREISFELNASRATPFAGNIDAFLDDAYQRCLRFTKMVREE